MTLVDTSAWVEYLRGSGSPAHGQLRQLIEEDRPLMTTEVVVMEVLAGGRDETHAARLRRLLGRCELVPMEGLADFEAAASLYRQCRRGGATVRALADCLVAAIALRADLEVLHADRDFAALAAHSELRLYGGGGV